MDDNGKKMFPASKTAGTKDRTADGEYISRLELQGSGSGSYRINPNAWGAVFAVPADIVDRHLKLAGSAQLKALLWMLRNNSDDFNLDKLADAVGLSRADTSDALQYWVETGILFKDGSEPVKIEQTPKKAEKRQEAPKAEQKPKAFEPVPEIVPTHEQVASRVLESPELKYLYSEAQAKLGKTIGYDTQAKLLMLHDHYGLPVEIILTIIEYAVSQGKLSTAYITKMGKDWAEREIDNLDKADEQLKKLNEISALWKKFTAMFSIDPPKHNEKRSNYLLKWCGQYGFDLNMVYLAYEETIDKTNKVSFEYTDSILKSWHEQGIRTPKDFIKAQNERKQQKAADKKPKSKTEASYDLNAFKDKVLNKPLVYEKGRK